MSTRGRRIIQGLIGGALIASLGACGKDNGCEKATQAMQTQIGNVCSEPAFRDTPFCRCCVPNGYLSIDDTCTCRPLVFDDDFCFYDDKDSGHPQIRSALVYAAGVCLNRPVNLPYGQDAGDRCVGPPVVAPDAGASSGQ